MGHKASTGKITAHSNGIIADLLVDFNNVGASAPGGGGAGDSLFSLVRALADTKTLACGKNYRSFRAEDPYKRKNYPAEQRAALVPKQYLSTARSLDHQVHRVAWGTVGPIEAALDGPDAHIFFFKKKRSRPRRVW
jgi:hypothetical protein